MRRIPIETFIGDYRSVDGLLLVPFKTRIFAMGQERILTLESVPNNGTILAELFELPTDVRALVEKKDDTQVSTAL